MIKGLHHNAYRCRDSEETASRSLSDLSFRRNYQIETGPRLDYYYNTTRRNETKCQSFPIFP